MTSVNEIYQSRKGTTRKVAEAIAQACGVRAIDINEPSPLGDTDLLFIGMGVYAGRPDASVMDYLDNLPAGKIRGAALFSTSATGTDRTELAVNLLEHKHITVYPKHLLLKGKFLWMTKGMPDEAELEKARQFAGEVLASFQAE